MTVRSIAIMDQQFPEDRIGFHDSLFATAWLHSTSTKYEWLKAPFGLLLIQHRHHQMGLFLAISSTRMISATRSVDLVFR